MKPFTAAKLILAACGLIIWGAGIRTGQGVLQYVGIAFMVAAVLLRFIKRPDTEG
jgi:hypothetical protein